MSKIEQVSDLDFEVLPNGGVELQQGLLEPNRISLHACHVRLLFERTGHLLPPTPANELVSRLALQLCTVLHDLAGEFGTSPGVDRVIDLLNAYVEALPQSALPAKDESHGKSELTPVPLLLKSGKS